MKVLLTGCPGWLGNRLLEVLTKGWEGKGPERNWELRCLVQPELDVSFINRLSKDIEVSYGSLLGKDSLRQACQGVEMVIHLAGLIHPRKISDLYAVNSRGTSYLLEAAVAAGARRFIYISSNSPAGVNTDRHIPMKESDTPNPWLNYGLSKLRAEHYVNTARQEKKLQTVILRPCWFYGPQQPRRQTRFFHMIKKGNPIIFGDGKNLRSMSYVDNTCQAILLAATTEQADGQTYWVADEKPYPTNEIYATVAALLGVQNFKPMHVPAFASDLCLLADRALQYLGLYEMNIHVAAEMTRDISVSVEKAKTELGYKPKIELKEGMWRSIEWCRAQGML